MTAGDAVTDNQTSLALRTRSVVLRSRFLAERAAYSRRAFRANRSEPGGGRPGEVTANADDTRVTLTGVDKTPATRVAPLPSSSVSP